MKLYHHYRQRIGLAQIGQRDLPPAPVVNPFKRGPNFNLTAAMEIERRDPALAARLKALAEQ